MATNIRLTSGSIFNGNPITLSIKPHVYNDKTMHRIVLEVECGMSGGNYEVIKLSSPVITEGLEQVVDISSALRTFRDSYVYTYEATTYPLVKFNVKAYDEYFEDGVLRKSDSVYYPQNPNLLPAERRDEAYYRTIFGAFTDIERITSGATHPVTRLSRKPTTLPQVVKVGETFAYTPPFAEPQYLMSTLEAPQSKVVNITKEGAQTLGYQPIFALPSTDRQERCVFRFINGFGVMESVSVLRQHKEDASHVIEEHVASLKETFNQMSHGVVRKSDGAETWQFSTGPLDEFWLRWYIHEFLMSENVWLQVGSTWLRVHLLPEETTPIKDATKNNVFELFFNARFDINGNPIL